MTISLLLGLLWMFLENQKKSMMATNKKADEIIGHIYKLNNDSLKNDSREIFWSDLIAHELIYFGDAIQTQNKSTVLIKLTNHQILTIEPETLIRFNKKDDDISLDLVQGEVKLTEAIDSPMTDSLEPENTDKPKLQNKRIFVKTPKGFVDSKTENILKITRKKENSESPKDEPLFIQRNEIPNIKFDDDVVKSQKLAVPVESLPRQPTAVSDFSTNDSSVIPQATEPTLPLPAAPLPLSVPKIKKMKLSADE